MQTGFGPRVTVAKPSVRAARFLAMGFGSGKGTWCSQIQWDSELELCDSARRRKSLFSPVVVN